MPGPRAGESPQGSAARRGGSSAFPLPLASSLTSPLSPASPAVAKLESPAIRWAQGGDRDGGGVYRTPPPRPEEKQPKLAAMTVLLASGFLRGIPASGPPRRCSLWIPKAGLKLNSHVVVAELPLSRGLRWEVEEKGLFASQRWKCD